MTRIFLTATVTSLALVGPFAASAESIDLKYDRTVPATQAADDRALVEATRGSTSGFGFLGLSSGSATADYIDNPHDYDHIR